MSIFLPIKLALSRILSVPKRNRIIFFQEFSLRRTAKQKMYSLIQLAGYYLFEVRKSRQTTLNLKKLKGSFSGKTVLVTANGPSLNKLDLKATYELHSLDKLVLFGINYSPLILDAKNMISLDYLVLSDHAMHPRNHSAFNDEFWTKVKSKSTLKLITPESWCDPIHFEMCRGKRCLHYNDRGAENLVKGTDPTKIRGYLSMTSLKALAICNYLGFNRIFVLGLDNNFFRGLEVNESLRLIENSHHASSIQHFEPDVTEYWPLGVTDYFYFVALNFYYIRKYFNWGNVVNLDVESLNDTFVKIASNDEYVKILRGY